LILFYDTETTGLPDFKAPSDAPHQPHIVQLAAILIDPVTRIERAIVDLIVKPDGWTIPDEVAVIHGITTETATSCGVPEQAAVALFIALKAQTAIEVAHNVSFDRRIMRIAMLRMGLARDEVEAMEGGESYCTMRSSTSIINLSPTARMTAAGFSKPKPPKLSECVKHFFGEDLEGAHNALNDVRACARVYFHLQALRDAA
jgi:DNA polymerase-3 subunit epsilon